MPSCHGKYKGFTFRSLLELSYFKFLESQGYVLGVDVRYEPCRIDYRIGNGRARAYVPDLYVVPLRLLVELKHSQRLKTRMNDAKFDAAQRWARDNDCFFAVLTEKDVVPQQLSELAQDPEIEWSEGTLKRRKFGKKIREARKCKKT